MCRVTHHQFGLLDVTLVVFEQLALFAQRYLNTVAICENVSRNMKAASILVLGESKATRIPISIRHSCPTAQPERALSTSSHDLFQLSIFGHARLQATNEDGPANLFHSRWDELGALSWLSKVARIGTKTRAIARAAPGFSIVASTVIVSAIRCSRLGTTTDSKTNDGGIKVDVGHVLRRLERRRD